MKTIYKVSLLFLLLISTTSCIVDGMFGIQGNRNVVSEDRTINTSFTSIKVQQGINLYLTQDTNTSLKVEADENIIDLLITEVKNDELKVYFEKNVNRAKARNVYLTASQIEGIHTSSGAFVKSENTITTNSLDLSASSGSDIKVYVSAQYITSDTSSGADIEIIGKTEEFTASASSGSFIDADELETTNANVRASSGADVNVNATNKLRAKASSGGDIDYEGNPTVLDKDTSSGGSVSRS